MSRTSPPDNTPPTRTGGVRAGRDLKADNIVTGVQVQGADAETARALLELARAIESGSVEAVRDIIAKNIVTGFQYVGQGGTAPNQEQFQKELAALREQLAQAVKAGEIEDANDAEVAQKAVAGPSNRPRRRSLRRRRSCPTWTALPPSSTRRAQWRNLPGKFRRQ
ncbi:MAG: hypothetical protein EHM35_18095 [Planctomycetaceae bacterium]|nr:MAG: hypothetical protein EHM35_18095 [Planctomycetaceae bacterium]